MNQKLKIAILRDAMLSFTCFIALIAGLRVLNIFDPVSYDPSWFNAIAALFTWGPFGIMVRMRLRRGEN
ncbi:MAG: hypothetical protein RSA63_02690 [Eubacterium sp.]